MSGDTRLWELDETTITGMRPKFRIKCPMCRPPWWMFWRRAQRMRVEVGYVFAFSLARPNDLEKVQIENRDRFAIDVYMRCPRCGLSEVHGVPLSRDEYEKKFKFIADKVKEEGLYDPAIERVV